MVRKLRAAVRTAIVVPTFIAFTGVIASVLIAVTVLRPQTRFADVLIRFWSRVFLFTGGARYQITGQEHVDPEGQYVFIANHQSNLDIPLMFCTAPVPIRYLAKKELFKIPIFAMAMRRVGIVKVDRARGAAIHTEVNAGVAAAKARGHSLIIFPEGTRTTDGKLQPFKKGAFRIAISNQLDIVPVTIQGTWAIWPPGSKTFSPGKAKATIHPPIRTAGMDLSDINALRDTVHSAITDTHEDLASGA